MDQRNLRPRDGMLVPAMLEHRRTQLQYPPQALADAEFSARNAPWLGLDALLAGGHGRIPPGDRPRTIPARCRCAAAASRREDDERPHRPSPAAHLCGVLWSHCPTHCWATIRACTNAPVCRRLV